MPLSDPPWPDLSAAIHSSEKKCVVAITGGGSGAISALLEQPGASQTVLAAVVPYASTALADWLGGVPDRSCSSATARAMAMSAWIRARELAPDDDPHQLLGLAATASLASNRPKRGDHRIHLAVQSTAATSTYSLTLFKGARDRLAEEELASQLLLLTLAKHSWVDTGSIEDLFFGKLLADEEVAVTQQQADTRWAQLLLGQHDYIHTVCSPPPLAGEGLGEGAELKILFPGAFNPLHAGHQRIAAIASERLGHPVTYELSLTNVDKPPLDYQEIATRLDQLKAIGAQVVLTRAPTFRTKAALFPGCTFLVGADTLARIADPSYYTGDPDGYEAALELIASHHCRFLVFGRQIEQQFVTLADIDLPTTLQQLCTEIPAHDFREDISSTELRGQ